MTVKREYRTKAQLLDELAKVITELLQQRNDLAFERQEAKSLRSQLKNFENQEGHFTAKLAAAEGKLDILFDSKDGLSDLLSEFIQAVTKNPAPVKTESRVAKRRTENTDTCWSCGVVAEP